MRKGRYIRRRAASKMLTTVLALLLVVGLSVGGTLAWLTATTDKVTNTFTVGDINIKLDEAPLRNDNTLDEEADRIQANNNYKIVPGGKSPKDPILTVLANSEDCYVYVSISNTLKLNGTVVVTPNVTADWTAVETNGDETLYRYKEVVKLSTDAQELPVFTEVTYSDTITKDVIETLRGKQIVLEGFAHQSANTDQATADAAAIAALLS